MYENIPESCRTCKYIHQMLSTTNQCGNCSRLTVIENGVDNYICNKV